MEKSQRKWSARRITGVLLAAAGVALAVVTAKHAATFDPEEIITLSAPAQQQAIFSYTAPGVLNLIEDKAEVTIAASPAAGEIRWAFGSSADVQSYVGESAARALLGYTQDGQGADIKDQAASDEVAEADAKVIEAGGFALHEGDMWSNSGAGEAKVVARLEVPSGVDRSIIATTEKGTAPQLTITWVHTKELTSPAPFVVIGVLLALIGAVLLLTDWRDAMRKHAWEVRAERRRAEKLAAAGAQTTTLPVFKGDLADPETDRSLQSAHTAGAFGAAVLPGAPNMATIRQRPLAQEDRIIIAAEASDRAEDSSDLATIRAAAEQPQEAENKAEFDASEKGAANA